MSFQSKTWYYSFIIIMCNLIIQSYNKTKTSTVIPGLLRAYWEPWDKQQAGALLLHILYCMNLNQMTVEYICHA